ncbi:hypothetical protein AX774_g5708 [Zancudomyces culisetae]|uniref:Uncharacterized protein n=1 Tax=Zancudomyces culisetae TaxID=1213189 RepID=A0A1R1PIU9_ZANCU|nr:hypothetical protein AX774_g5708 [Zancudomyces culisetae]|eukprot:OMH80849.1 hypothetical protein AX774_g5708 [Zancudomyces culisetae]
MDKYEITKGSDSKKTGESDSDHELEINSLESVHLEQNTAFEQSNAIEMSKPTANNSKGHDNAKEGHNLAQDIDRQKFNTDKHQSIIDINNDDVGYLSGGLGDVRNNIGKSDSRNRRLDTLLSIEMNSNSDEGSGNGDRSLKNAGPLGKIRLVAPTLSTRRQRRSTGHPSIKTLLSRNEGTQGGIDNSGTDNNMNSIENSDREFENMNLGGLDAIKEINEVHSEEQVESDESIAQSGESEPPPSLLVENAGLERNKRGIHRFKKKQTSKRHLNAGHTEGLYGNRASPRNLEVDRVRGRRLQGSRIGFGRENTLGTEYEYLDPGFSGATPSRSYRFSNVERGRESMDRIYEQDDTAPLIGTSVKKNKRGREQGKEKRKNNKNEQAYLQRALRDWRSQKLLDEFLARVYDSFVCCIHGFLLGGLC